VPKFEKTNTDDKPAETGPNVQKEKKEGGNNEQDEMLLVTKL
jgi:hypothetical protein